MFCNSDISRNFQASRTTLYSIIFLLYAFVQLSAMLPIPNMDYSTTAAILTNNSTTNSSLDDNLYIIKAVVYEIGILTDADNSSEDTTERQEEVKISFYNPPSENTGP